MLFVFFQSYFFCQPTVFFSYNKLANSFNFLDQRTGPPHPPHRLKAYLVHPKTKNFSRFPVTSNLTTHA